MYNVIEGGSTISIQGLRCNLPPVGFVFNIVTRELDYVGVYKRSEIESEQYWERMPYPDWYEDVLKEEARYDKRKKEDDDPFYNEQYEKYKQQEWHRRLNGMWIWVYNPSKGKSEPIYLTGFYYMLLQWFSIDIGYAKFIFPHLYKTYFLQYCIEDPLCMGMIDVTKRRFLKTFIGGLFVLEYTTRTKMVQGALQSKTGNDAKKVFGKAVVYPFRKFPRFFRPEYDMSLGVNPKTEIRFQQTNIRGKKAEDGIDKDELGSMIDWGSADPIHYDGSKIQRYFSDEWGKTTEANIYDRHEVIRYCLMDEEGKIIGKALYSTTVEKLESDKDGVQEAARQLWKASDQTVREENGMTQSGLYRFFQTADETRNFDKYGYADKEKTISAILSDRESVKHNPRSLSARMRKEPRTIEEAFSIDADDCQFNVFNITNQRKQIQENPKYLRRGTFYEEGRGIAKWRDDKNGLWDILEFPPIGEENKHQGDVYKTPDRTSEGLISVDSYSGYQGGRKYGSKACGFIFDKRKNMFIGMFYGRPQYKEQLHEQIRLAGIFYGFKIFYEQTADDYEGYFRTRNDIGYLGRFPLAAIDPAKRNDTVRLFGFPITPFAMTKQLDEMILYIEYFCHLIWFDKLLEQCIPFDPYDRTKSDCVVSAMIGVVSAMDIKFVPPKPKSSLIPKYTNN